MIFQSFLLGNLGMKIINSVVMFGLYYGFLSTLSMGPSSIFLLRAMVMEEEEGEEGTEKKVSATTGFIMGKLMIFISIYYTPLHLALGRPHTITVLALPYLLFHFFGNNHKHFFGYGSTSKNSMRNLSIQRVFLNNLIFQLFNHFFLPNSTLPRLVNIYMFRCNNKMLFVTSSFVGWLIGHILFMKRVELVLVWIESIRSNRSIRSNKYLKSSNKYLKYLKRSQKYLKYLVSELINSMDRIFSILLFITCVYYLGRMPSPIFTHKLKETSETKESEEETDIEIEKTSETEETKQEEEEDPDKIQDISKLEILKEENKNLFWFEKPLLSLLFDYKRWNRPTRYIKNNRFENAVRNEMSQYFFYPCQNDGKQRISFSYPPSLAVFWEMIQRKISLSTTDKLFYDELYNYWIYTNEQKKNSLSNEFSSRIAGLDKGLSSINVFEKKTRLCNDTKKKEYLPKIYDPFLNGSYRGPYLRKQNSQLIKKGIDGICINRIHNILRKDYNYHEFEQKKNTVEKKSLSIEIRHFMSLMNKLDRKSTSNLKEISLLPEDREKFVKFFFDTIITDSLTQKNRKKPILIKEIKKKVPRWSYNLTDELEEEEKETEGAVSGDHQIISREAKRVVIFTDTNPNKADQLDEIALIRYPLQSDFRRDLIMGSMGAQRRKTVIWNFLQPHAHSPLFIDRTDNFLSWGVDLLELIQGIRAGKIKKFSILNSIKKKINQIMAMVLKKERRVLSANQKEQIEEQRRLKISEVWDTVPYGQLLRGLLLLTHSRLRKYILLPLLIIVKNLGRLLLSQRAEWSEDFNEWKSEIHVNCTYNGVELSETEFPKDWVTDGIQIKIVFPFRLKPWHRSKIRPSHPDQTKNNEQNEPQKVFFSFFTVWGMETGVPFGPPRQEFYFFKTILNELNKKIREFRKIGIRRIRKEKRKLFRKVSNETKKLSIVNQILVFVLRKKSNERKKENDFRINNQMINESSIEDQNLGNSSETEKEMKDLANRTGTTRKEIDEIRKKIDEVGKKRDEIRKKRESRTVNISPNKTHYGVNKRLESLKKIVKRKKVRLIRKSICFIKIYREKIYRDLFLNISRIYTLLRSTKNIFDKSISNNETNQERTDTTNKKTIPYINKNSKSHSDLSFLSQAYVFYKLSQAQRIYLYKLRSVFQYDGTSLFLKNEIKDYFGTQEITHLELRTKKLPNSGMNQWKNWLKSNYQYDLSQIKWSRLVPQKWRNRMNEYCWGENTNLKKKKWNSKEQLINSNYQNANNSEAHLLLLPDEKENFKKNYRYDVLAYKFIYYEDKKDSYRNSYGAPFQVNKNQEFSYTYNYNIYKDKLIDMWWSIPIIMDIEKNTDRKYLNWKIYQEINRSHQTRNLFDWMGMNEEILSHPISNLESWFFPEFFLLYNGYKKKPWAIPINLLFSNFYLSENKNINKKTKKNSFIFSKKYLELENQNQDEKELVGQEDLRLNVEENSESVFSSQHKDIQEDSIASYGQKPRKQKLDTNSTETELDVLLKRNLLCQLRWNPFFSEELFTNMKVYCRLLRLSTLSNITKRNLREVTISYIAKKEMNLGTMLIKNDLFGTEFLRQGILIIEPIRLSIKDDGQFILYQTIGISLVHKSKHQKKRYNENLVTKNLDESVSRHEKMTENRDKNDCDFPGPENILSPRRRRELRILTCFNSRNNKGVAKNPGFWNGNRVKNCSQFFDESKDLDRYKKKLIKLKLFLWPNYRLEDLACMNRYWFDTNNGSRFSVLRIHMYPQFKTHFRDD